MTVALRPSIRLLQTRLRQILQRLVALVALGILFWWLLAAPAQSIETNWAQLEYVGSGWNPSTDFGFDLSSSLKNAVNRGIAPYFLVKFELIRPRWCWFDNHAISTTRMVRLSHHPFIRQHRVSIDGLQVPPSRLKDAVDFMQHTRGWRVFGQHVVETSETVRAEVYARPDVTQLPKSFQISAVNMRGWSPGSEWKRFNLLASSKPPPALSSAPAAPPLSTPASTPLAFGSSDLSPSLGWGMSVDPSSSGTSPAPAK